MMFSLLKRSSIFVSLIFAVTISAVAQTGWAALTSPQDVDLIAVFFINDRSGWVAGDDGYLAVTNDGGRNWAKVPLNITDNINEIYFRSEKDGYLVAGRKMFVTSDGGRSWNETTIFRQGTFRPFIPEFLSIRFADRKRGIVVGSLLRQAKDDMIVVDSLVMRTEDGGGSWHRIQMPTKTELFHLDYNGSSHGWIVGDNGVILATTDAGRTWTKQVSGTTNGLFNVDFRDDNEGYVVGENGTILRTENGGRTWTRVITNLTETLMRVDFADDKNGWIVGHKGTILRSSDKGKTWIKQASTTANSLYGLFMSRHYGWAVGAKGIVVGYQR
jgi:photosystem II stability/assembly factor-like uncharacterized protein